MAPYEIILIIVGGLLIVFILWYISVMNYLRRLEVKVEESLSGIDVALTKRYDVLTKMLDTTKGYSRHESETLEKIVRLRKGQISELTIDQKADVGKNLDKIQSGINVIVEKYPDLKANAIFIKLQNMIADVEEHLQAARRFYNSNVTLINQAIVTFPQSIIARNIKMTKKLFFEAEENKKSDVKMEF